MGYQTTFTGRFTLDKPLDDALYNYLVKFNETRRMARNVDPKYGAEGEFYVDGKGYMGQDSDETVIDCNRPPSTQPTLWCQWRPSEDRMGIEWDGGEKFYEYHEWLNYLIKNFLTPNGYKLSGLVSYQGEEEDDFGTIDASHPSDNDEPVAGYKIGNSDSTTPAAVRKVSWKETAECPTI